MLRLLLCLAAAQGSFAIPKGAEALAGHGGPQAVQKPGSCPHHHAHRKAGRQIQAAAPASTGLLRAEANDTHIRVAWDNPVGGWAKPWDWIGLFRHGRDPSLFTSPIEFIYAREALPNATHESKPPVSGEVVFPRYNWRHDIYFLYVSGTQMYPEVSATSNVVVDNRRFAPLYPRLALRDGETHVTWTQENQTGPAAARLWHAGVATEVPVWLVDTFGPEDLCDAATAPAAKEGWFPPGDQLTANLGALKPRTTYALQVGRGQEWSELWNFTTGPEPGARVRLITFGDMGQMLPESDRVYEHDFNNLTGQLGSYPTVRVIERLAHEGVVDGVLHFGDIAYATGYLSEWTTFLHLIDPVARTMPWQTSMGNHEMGYSGSWDFLNTSLDSGGECGVPMRAFFPMCVETTSRNGTKLPLKERQAWYAFRIGNAHIIMLNSEEDFRPGSPQAQWLTAELAKVDRKVTPWLIVTIHRPALLSSLYDGDYVMAAALQRDLVPALEAANVDLILSGHHHTYQRMCRFYRGKCVDARDNRGIHYYVMGMGGYPLQDGELPNEPYAQMVDQNNYGVGLLDLVNETHAQVTFVTSAGVRDQQWITRVPETVEVFV